METTLTIIDPVSLDSVNWKPIIFANIGAVSLQARTPVDIYIATVSDPRNKYRTIKAGQSFEIDINTSNQVFYFKAASDGVWLEIAYLSQE